MTTNRITLEQMPDISVAELAQMPIDHLFGLQGEIRIAKARAAGAEDKLNAALALRTEGPAAELRKAAGKVSGTCRLNDDGLVVLVDLPKRVKWDQAALRAVIDQLEAMGEPVGEYIDTEFKVSETAYNSWPSSLRTLFEPARTVSTGKPKIEIVEPK